MWASSAASRQVFAKLYALERRDFTDPGYVTGWVRVWVARLAFYFRPDVWRGNDGHNGIGNPDSVIVVACGLDEISLALRRGATLLLWKTTSGGTTGGVVRG